MEDRLSRYQKLPQAVQDFLFDADKEKDVLAALKKFGLDETAAFDLVLLAEDVVLGTLKLSELSAKVGKNDVARELITQRLLPLDAYLPGVDDELKRLGGDPQTKEVERIEKEELTPAEFVRDSLKEAKVHLSDASLQSRLEFLLSSYVRGVRSEPQTISALGRAVKVGGLELPEAQAKQLLEILDKRRPAFDIEVGAVGEMAERSGQGAGSSKQRAASKEQQAGIGGATMPRRERKAESREQGAESRDQQVPTLGAKAPQQPVTPKPQPPITQLPNYQVTISPDLAKRLETITQARLKDLRNAMQTKTMLGQGVLLGGLGLTGADLDRAAAEVEKQYAAKKAQEEQQAESSKQQYLQEQRMKKEESSKQKTASMEQEMGKRYTALTGKAPQSVKPIVPRLSSASLPPVSGSGKPQMVDVKYEPKLTGPVEELAHMGAADFRRLASDPLEATMKIRDKIDLLGNESYEKKVAGMRAWKASPLNQLYVSLSQEALKTGQPIDKVCKSWKEQGQDFLTIEEVKAIVALNAELRF